MFGIALMGICTSGVQLLARLVTDVFAGIFGLTGVGWAVTLGMAQGLEFGSTIMCETLLTLLRALTCGFFF